MGRDQKFETNLGCENVKSQNTIVKLIGLMERQMHQSNANFALSGPILKLGCNCWSCGRIFNLVMSSYIRISTKDVHILTYRPDIIFHLHTA